MLGLMAAGAEPLRGARVGGRAAALQASVGALHDGVGPKEGGDQAAVCGRGPAALGGPEDELVVGDTIVHEGHTAHLLGLKLGANARRCAQDDGVDGVSVVGAGADHAAVSEGAGKGAQELHPSVLVALDEGAPRHLDPQAAPRAHPARPRARPPW